MIGNKEIASLLEIRETLLRGLETVTRRIEDAQTEVFRHIASNETLVQRYFSGDRIVISFDRWWWVSVDGDLLGLVSESDIDAMRRLTASGVFEKVTIEK